MDGASYTSESSVMSITGLLQTTGRFDRPFPTGRLTVFLICQFQHHVLLTQLVIDLLQIFDVINGLPQNARLVHLGRKREEIQLKQCMLESGEQSQSSRVRAQCVCGGGSNAGSNVANWDKTHPNSETPFFLSNSLWCPFSFCLHLP